jgi:hypothetical protein
MAHTCHLLQCNGDDTLKAELKAAGNAVASYKTHSSRFGNSVVWIEPSENFLFDESRPLLSTFVKLDLSEDWFTGLSGYNMSEREGIPVNSYPFSAGFGNQTNFWRWSNYCDTLMDATGGPGVIQSLMDPSAFAYEQFRYNDYETYPIAQWECHTSTNDNRIASAACVPFSGSSQGLFLLCFSLLAWLLP